MFYKVNKLMPHFEHWSTEHRPEKPHGPSRPLSSLDGEKSQDGSRTSRPSQATVKGLSFNSGLSAQLPSWLGASWDPCLHHPCVLTCGPPQPVGTWGSWDKVSVPCGRSSDPLPALSPAIHESREGVRRHSLSHYITHFIFFYFTPISLTSPSPP